MKKEIIDGNTACALIAYKMSEIAPIYPITPSSTMAELYDVWSNEKQKNIFEQVSSVIEMQSEAGASGTLHGVLRAGTLGTTFTASQGLLLMIPNMFKIAGECLPCVMHVSARAVATHALSIFGDHSDVMACRSTGFCMLCSSNPQQAHDFALVSHLSALDCSLPFLHFFDGFRTSHELAQVKTLDLDETKSLVDFDKIEQFRKRGLSNAHPSQFGTSQGADVFFANREKCNALYEKVPQFVQDNFDKVAKITGRQFHVFDYYGDKDAQSIIVIMGSGADVVRETIENLKGQIQGGVGVVCVRLYRPFATQQFLKALPKTAKRICVLDRTKESGAIGEPLFLDVASCLQQANIDAQVIGGRYGLGSFEFNPAMVKAVIDNLVSTTPKNHFTVGINDDVSHTSLDVDFDFTLNDNNIKCVFFGLGGDGTVSANKNSTKIIGNNSQKYVQGYYAYDSKKSGSMTISHLRFGDAPILSSYKIDKADFVAIHNPTFLSKIDTLQYLKQNGTVLLNISTQNGKIVLPQKTKQELQDKNAKIFAVDAEHLAKQIGLKNKINVIMQTAFFKTCPVIDFKIAKKEMQKYIEKSYSKFGNNVVELNKKAIDVALENLKEISFDEIEIDKNLSTSLQNTDCEFYTNIMQPIAKLNGEKIPVSAFSVDGEIPTDTAKYEKRGIATQLPKWKSENCLQCNLCSLVCPHSALAPKILDENDDKLNALQSIKANGKVGKKFVLSCSPLDCTGCGNCANICPAKNKAIEMQEATTIQQQLLNDYEILQDVQNEQVEKPNVVSSQFNQSLFRFSGACAGCGQTPYLKLLTQLFGEQMIVANATGCSSIYSGSFPSCPYSKTQDGFGPAWANSLFEDNAEFGLGLKLGKEKQLEKYNALKQKICEKYQKINEIYEKYAKNTDFLSKKLCFFEIKSILKNLTPSQELKQFEEMFDLELPSSQWIVGGDGWAYDIGFGGLDHILASNFDVNILVLDTEIYSNTGGQASKSTPQNATAKFCDGGKKTAKKDLARIASQYPNCYVAKVCLSANPAHTLRCFQEAKNHNGPSIIIAYAPCVGQGVDLTQTPTLEKMAVSSGYWELLHRNPNDNNGEIVIDSPKATTNLDDFLKLQTRFKKYLATKED